MAGDEGRVPGKVETGLGLEDPHHGKAHGHQGGLGVGRECQIVGRTLPDDGRELLGQRFVDLVEHGPGLRKGFGERLAHPDGLTALPRKDKRALHASSSRKRGGTRIEGRMCQADAQPGHREMQING